MLTKLPRAVLGLAILGLVLLIATTLFTKGAAYASKVGRI